MTLEERIELRKKMYKAWSLRTELDVTGIAEECGISPNSYHAFIKNPMRLRVQTLMKIKAWVDRTVGDSEEGENWKA